MNRSIFSKSFDEIFTAPRLLYELAQLKPRPNDYSQVVKEIKAGHFFETKPKQSFFIPKSDGSYREITISSTKTKVIQKVLATQLSSSIKFCDRSYAFRKGKSPYKAIRRVQDNLKRFNHIAKADIQNFFDTIDHTILINKLHKIIKDKKIIHLIAYYISQGTLLKNHWVDKSEGIYQGDVLSPLLSNIYLNDFDFYLVSKNIEFVRYADDMLFFGKSKEQVSHARRVASDYLQKLKLHFNPKKTYLSNIDKGFSYLGVSFLENRVSIDTVKLARKIEKLKQETKKLPLKQSVEKLNQKVIGFKNYYAKLIDDEVQFTLLQNVLEEIVIKKIIKAKTTKTFNSKAEIKEVLNPLESYIEQKSHNKWIESLISRAYSEIAMQTPLKSAKKRVASQKREYLQEHLKASEIVVSKVGAFIGFSQGKIKVKIKGKVVLEAPINKIKRILLLNKQSSISSYLIHECAKRKIDIDFIEHNKPYAMLTYYQHISPQLHLVQLKTHFSPRGLAYAREIAHTKSRNQINLMKYLNRRRKDRYISKKLEAMLKLHHKIKNAKDRKLLMGLEGNISVHYWAIFGHILKIDNFIRTHQNSQDAINQALNYGYAILYNRVQSALLHEGLNLYYPLLHSFQPNKPTLVFDMVESFRQPVVDREILAMLNRGQKLTQSNGRLSQESIKLIIQNIQERLATPTPSRYGKSPLYNIIGFQMNHLKRTLLDNTTYKGFVNKY